MSDARRVYVIGGSSGMVARALRKGMLAKQPCSRCSNPKAVARHEDYSRPLDVTWLCGSCHTRQHRERGDYKLWARLAKTRGDAIAQRENLNRAALLTVWINEQLRKDAAMRGAA